MNLIKRFQDIETIEQIKAYIKENMQAKEVTFRLIEIAMEKVELEKCKKELETENEGVQFLIIQQQEESETQQEEKSDIGQEEKRSKTCKMNEIDIIKEIVFAMFNQYTRDSSSNQKIQKNTIENKKRLISKFEKVIKGMRYKVLDNKKIFELIQDDLELLVQLSQVNNLRECLDELVREYLQVYGQKCLIICFYK